MSTSNIHIFLCLLTIFYVPSTSQSDSSDLILLDIGSGSISISDSSDDISSPSQSPVVSPTSSPSVSSGLSGLWLNLLPLGLNTNPNPTPSTPSSNLSPMAGLSKPIQGKTPGVMWYNAPSRTLPSAWGPKIEYLSKPKGLVRAPEPGLIGQPASKPTGRPIPDIPNIPNIPGIPGIPVISHIPDINIVAGTPRHIPNDMVAGTPRFIPNAPQSQPKQPQSLLPDNAGNQVKPPSPKPTARPSLPPIEPISINQWITPRPTKAPHHTATPTKRPTPPKPTKAPVPTMRPITARPTEPVPTTAPTPTFCPCDFSVANLDTSCGTGECRSAVTPHFGLVQCGSNVFGITVGEKGRCGDNTVGTNNFKLTAKASQLCMDELNEALSRVANCAAPSII